MESTGVLAADDVKEHHAVVVADLGLPSTELDAQGVAGQIRDRSREGGRGSIGCPCRDDGRRARAVHDLTPLGVVPGLSPGCRLPPDHAPIGMNQLRPAVRPGDPQIIPHRQGRGHRAIGKPLLHQPTIRVEPLERAVQVLDTLVPSARVRPARVPFARRCSVRPLDAHVTVNVPSLSATRVERRVPDAS